jgi:hypothetical protein
MMIARTMGLVSALALTVGCGGQDRIIVVNQGPASPGGGGAAAVAGPGSGTAQAVAGDGEWGIVGQPKHDPDYRQVVHKVASMVTDHDLQDRVGRRGLHTVNVMWEDTGRAEGSSLGPNISDLTLQVRMRDESGQFESALMPVIRFPNFSDRTGDIPADKFFVRTGNEREGGSLSSVPLTDVLRNIHKFISVPSSIKGNGNLLAPRDSHFLVSAQAVFLPIPKEGKAEFNPVIFNYQSTPESPAVLTLLITRQGTSVSVIENRSEDASPVAGMGQELYFNNGGQRAAFTAERKSDVEARIESQGGPVSEDDKTALQKGADVLFLVQVPLVHANRGMLGGAMGGAPAADMAPMKPKSAAPAPPMEMEAEEQSDVEQAVLGHGPNLGPYNEGRGLRLVRDPKFPIRVTVQFYKATSNGVVDEKDLDSIARSIGSVYEHADFVGSLVLPEGDPRRPTAWQNIPGEWFPW